MGPLRQLLFACITCNPPPKDPSDTYTPAAVCYSCSVQCHGEHTLVELFNKRNFVCDCGTTRYPSTTPCVLRWDPETNQKGVAGEEPDPKNKYNQNFQNRFCGCGCDYDADSQKGTMFQCLGLGTVADGGCGEDWYHPACVVGLDPSWHDTQVTLKKKKAKPENGLQTITEDAEVPALTDGEDEVDEDAPPPGFPEEDDFEGFICYKCVEANPWIKRYAGSEGFLPPVFKRSAAPSPEIPGQVKVETLEAKTVDDALQADLADQTAPDTGLPLSKKRKASEEANADPSLPAKRHKDEESPNTESNSASPSCKYTSLPPPPKEKLSLFFKPDFRLHLCRCPSCFPLLQPHPQLLDEEDNYEPPVSHSSSDRENNDASSAGGSLLDRGEKALSAMDRVRAIEGVMAYNHLKEKLTPFLREFAESGRVVGAEDVKEWFKRLRGDEEVVGQTGEGAQDGGGSGRREERGY
jgi:E3 ubiquitin-protein ligase UBR7